VTAPPNGGIGISGPAGNRTWTYPTGDDYADSLAVTADGRTLALSFFVAYGTGPGTGFQDVLLNTKSRSRTAAGASRILSSVPVSTTLAISPDGRTVYACASDGTTGTLAAYSTVVGAQIRLRRSAVNARSSSSASARYPAASMLAAGRSGRCLDQAEGLRFCDHGVRRIYMHECLENPAGRGVHINQFCAE